MWQHLPTQRISVTVESHLHARSTAMARRRAVPTSLLIREALERYVSEQGARRGPEPLLPPRPLPDWVGMLEGPGGTYAARDEEILADYWIDAVDHHEA